MKLDQQQIADARAVYEAYWDSYLGGDVETFSSTLDDHYSMIGTSENEICRDKLDGLEFCKTQTKEVIGKVEKRNQEVETKSVNGMVLINEFFDLYVLIDSDWNFYSKTRISTLLKENKDGWKVLQQHGSLPDNRVDGDETLAIERINRENIELRDAIKRRTAELEDKNRELEIEAALERIRAQATSMKESSDLLDIVVTMRTEFVNLGHEAHYFWHMRWLPETYKKAMTSGDGSRIGMVMTLPRHIHGDIEPVAEWEKSNELTHVLAMDVDTAVDYVDKMISLGDFERVDPQAPSLDDIRHIGGLTFIMARTTHGEIGFSLPGVVPDPPKNAVDTLVRFAGVFDLAYKRFEDLKDAERQHREAQIELALERVRARTMAMRNSDELAEASSLLFQQMEALGVHTYSSGFTIWDEKQGNLVSWMCNADGSMNPPFRMPIEKEKWHKEQYYSWKKRDDFIVKDLNGEEMKSYFRYLRSFQLLDEAFKTSESAGHPMPERQVHHVANFSQGNLLFITLAPVPKAHDIFRRFAKVFEQTYTRFLDLQKAEAQAKEAKIELSLERIRAQVTAMRESSDLFDIVVSMRSEFISLGHEADYFWHMRWLPDVYEMSMTSEDGHRLGMVIKIPKFVHDQITDLAEWEKGSDPTYVLALDVDEAWDYIENMNEHGDYEVVDPNAPSREDIEHIGGLTFIIARTTHGEVGYSLPGVVPKPPTDALDTLVSFAGVFDLAYKRFEDLKAAEHQALLIRKERDRLEIALKELHATQDQLIQQEKLASLGQLTAGIAHEIKNPLNFVNNFSEVSVELIEEAREEIKEINSKFKIQNLELSDLLDDIETNLRKIHEHGSRADSIVKSMLEHSRGGSGIMEPTDLNSLVKEFVNLTFHGMRASKNPINVDMEFDLDDLIGKVPLIAEDFSRVIINLCNNAFDAMREKLNSNDQAPNSKGYAPKLTVQTYKKHQAIFIEISDNGTGISQEIKDKIFQPFFTTKKGTQGTGLGLSITNDIIKAHGGFLEVSTNQYEGTSFTIKLSTGG